MKSILLLFVALIGIGWSTKAQEELTQTVRGTVIDVDTKMPIIGAKIILPGTEPLQGGLTDENGDFRITAVVVGRIAIKITAVGYQDIYLPTILVESGKEKILNLEMTPDVKTLKEVEITATQDKSASINKMATVSGKTFSVEETNRYSGTFNDPARMAAGFAGVVGDAEGDNDIVVRGNSPRGILWRLEGIDIPNPNHFAGEGATGGPINALNGAMLANSDFFSGAFAPEYGNALSGVFDVRFRQGNNERREYSFSAGVMGIDATLEGPFSKNYRGSYLVNYRYSSIALLDKAGILDFGGVPVYQDASFKFHFPTKKMGTFSLIGLGGASHILQVDENDSGKVFGQYDVHANLGVVGLKHIYIVNPKLYVKSFVSAATQANWEEAKFLRTDSSELYDAYQDKFVSNNIKVQSILNYKMNAKNMFQVGATYTHLNYRYEIFEDWEESGVLSPTTKAKGNSGMFQSFLSWKYRISNDLSVVSGVNHTHFLLNDNYAVEPRLGIKWQINPKHDVAFGFGMHSRLESLSTYLYNELDDQGDYIYPNRNLDFSRSNHFVVGYGTRLSENMRFRSEVYYQHLYGLPVVNDSSSSFALLNTSGGIPSDNFVNEGTGRNYGVEVTLERYFNNDYYFLMTGSLYRAKYTALDGVERNGRYDANYAANFIAGKEFTFGKTKNKVFGINTKISLLGGNRYTPIRLAASQDAGYTIRDWDNPYSAKGDDVFLMNLGFTYRVNKKKTSHSLKIDFQNLTNNQAVVNDYFNSRTNTVDYDYQLSFIPNLIYTIKF